MWKKYCQKNIKSETWLKKNPSLKIPPSPIPTTESYLLLTLYFFFKFSYSFYFFQIDFFFLASWQEKVCILYTSRVHIFIYDQQNILTNIFDSQLQILTLGGYDPFGGICAHFWFCNKQMAEKSPVLYFCVLFLTWLLKCFDCH